MTKMTAFFDHRPVRSFSLAIFFLVGCTAVAGPQEESSKQKRTVKGMMQDRPGAPLKEVEVEVHEVPVDVPSVPANEASLDDDELVLGVEIDGQPVAYPIRYLALFEIVDDRVGETPVAPSW
jgi:hypothetical protein